ncbi:hypothetical protein GA0070609_0706 [Micromonospora echinaurantiaca]|uniref:MerR, DNA binding n=2 Tax=Micromonospora echinaurantiaca TaxID=47857 RepID=A0A1C5GZX5_9ACTN|nr:hypothetical protein GA0070609_0706 [Micromonospora echinaurantiaca]
MHDDGGRLTPSACPGMVEHLERERARIAEAMARLGTERQALDTLLAAMPTRDGRSDVPGREQPAGE